MTIGKIKVTSGAIVDIDAVIDKPYAELTEDEIEAVIEWKSQVKANEEQFQQKMAALKEAQEAQLEIMKADAEAAQAAQNEFLQASISRLAAAEKASKAVADGA